MVDAGESEPIARLRILLFAVLLLGALGTLAELWLLEHYEDAKQFVPLVLLGVAPFVIVAALVHPATGTLRLFRLLMLAFVVSGMLGVWFHYSGNTEFELEMYPSRAGFELFSESLRGATPVLAPGSMAWMGLLGLAASYRHPRLRPGA